MHVAHSALVLFALSASLHAQTITPEVEPNETKPTATTPVVCFAPGDLLVGTTTGSSALPGPASIDVWRIQVCPQGPGLHENRFLLHSGIAGHASDLRGLAQVAGAPVAGSDVAFQSTSVVPGGTANLWYGIGQSEELYLSVRGTPLTTATYSAGLSSTPVTPIPIAGTFRPGPITVTTVGLSAADTELTLLDANFAPVLSGHNDDEGPGGASGQSRLVRNLLPGRYYLALSDANTATHLGDANPDEDALSSPVLDFPDWIANASAASGLALAFTISDGLVVTPLTAMKAAPFQVLFFSFDVDTRNDIWGFCYGDGLDPVVTTPCPCGPGGAGRGCPNSVGAGAALSAAGTGCANNVVLFGQFMPASSSAIYLSGTATTFGGTPFGDGVLCIGGALRRLATRVNVGGASAFPAPGSLTTLSAASLTMPCSGDVRHYQTYYRNAAPFCTPATFNVTNAVSIVW